jgi:hypothetical protein|nr:MAG TPA: baseplate wedge protein [Caudoviricetes sp.]DAP57160.1 MAG TPA: baseplate wedge protein [Caudoviricetes sp.]DAS00418.1 MAG TPA: baseplate wedge protein [Caudoviricetes sp.]DAV72425.1 MAG TPA: baseplate wedge protein [Caudoviricetes sp.]DAV96728.1 MAG TPA: baseplate wedge protein [Caudoviricetes sp.]
MSLLEQTLPFIDQTGSEEGFRVVLEDHLSSLKTDIEDVILIDPVDAVRFEYDLNGLLRYKGIPIEQHWIIMRVNNMMSPEDYRRDRLTLNKPSTATIAALRNYYNQVVKRSAG